MNETSEEVDGAEGVGGSGDGVPGRVPHFIVGATGPGGAFDAACLVVRPRLAAGAARHVFGAGHVMVAFALAKRQFHPFAAGRSRFGQFPLAWFNIVTER